MNTFLYLAFINIYLVFFCVQADIGDVCQLESTKSSGQCAQLGSCPDALKEIRDGKNPQICEFQGKEPIVCCAGNMSNLQGEEERISIKKCKEYGELVYEELKVPSLISVEKTIKVSNCVSRATALIIGGANARPKEFPHMALLGFEPQNDKNWLCTGSLISEQFVLTAAHCLNSREYGEVRWIRLGDFNIATDDDDAQPLEFDVQERIKHPQFKPPSYYHDIALLKMDRAVPFSKYIRPACLYTGVPALTGNQRFFATGWNLNFNFEKSGMMQNVVYISHSNSECNESYDHNRKLKFGILADSQICAGSQGFDKTDCQTDSGSPLQIFSKVECMFDIVGVNSFGKPCGFNNVSNVYSSVLHYLDWIETTVWP